jgi:serine phosphatase RsbU (regulator of sigma subunit)
MAKRGPSISIKMILTTTLLIVVTVVGSGLLNVINIRGALDEAAKTRVDDFRRDRELLGENGTSLFGRAAEGLLYDKGRDIELLALLREAVAQDTKEDHGKKDDGLKFAYILDPNQAVATHCMEGATLDCYPVDPQPGTPSEHLPIDAKIPGTNKLRFGQFGVDTWTKAKALWADAATNQGGPLVKFDIAADGAKYQVFAFPVFGGAPATASGAIASDPPPARRGYVVLGYDLAPIESFAADAAQDKAKASKRAAIYTGAVGALFALIGTVLAIIQGLSITRPIKELAWRADQIARGDLQARVEVTSGDEIGFLGENFNFMADQISILLQQTAEKARLEQELEVAKAIQEALVPGDAPIDRDSLKFAGFYQPAAQTGGDWWTWSELGGGKILLVIGDVTGHGVPSAMITAAAKAACDVARHVHGDDVTVSRLLEIMNHAIFESAQRRFVMTCFASIIDTRARTITYANAGHNFPYLFRSGEGKGEFGSLIIRGNRLGDDRSSRYEAKTTELVPGDVLIWYTDGIVECESETGEEYGEKRFRASVRRAAALGAGEMRDAIAAEATRFFGETPRKDDITMIVGRIH